MATRAANKRLTREYATITASPPPYITAHPSEANILEWHYILTGPPDTPYSNGQYWGTLLFPPTYPFSPPAIRMHTPSGRFHPSTRLCLSISDFHPKSFNPAWEVSTILIGLLSFMTSEEMTTGSLSASEGERRWFAARSRWWNSTGGGSGGKPPGTIAGGGASSASSSASAIARGIGAARAGDGGVKFRAEWEELDRENWRWIARERVDAATGLVVRESGESCSPEALALLKGPRGGSVDVVGGVGAVRGGVRGWMGRHKWVVGLIAVVGFVLLQRAVVGEEYR